MPDVMHGLAMPGALIREEIAPLGLLFAGLVAGTLLLDAALHAFGLVWIGRYLGIPGVLLIGLSMLYSLRKRRRIEFSTPVRLLKWHKLLAWLGALLVLVHAGIHFNAWLPWLAVFAMLINVLSGLTGTYLLGRARRHLESRRDELRARGLDANAIDELLLGETVTVDALKRWRVIHLPIAMAFAALALEHIASIALFWSWH